MYLNPDLDRVPGIEIGEIMIGKEIDVAEAGVEIEETEKEEQDIDWRNRDGKFLN